AKKRPKEVKDWVGRARHYTPTIADADAFGEVWWDWWVDINPSWRGKRRPMNRFEGSSWSCMDYPGQNGFLNILMCLKWWRDAMETESRDWKDAIEDVTWAL
ncbi:hypothetical protein C8R47DRAFT_916658, partial [Mycena vitilis]